jgi:pimeloyl-ACP methyl ester carboxylesterase
MTTPSDQPLFFGQSGQRLFGTYHPASTTSGDVALLICAPFGNEDVCAYKSLRQVAQAAAEQHIPALRFDYTGCGNSEGDEHTPGLMQAWLDNIVEACATLRQLSGAKHVVLLGLRLGAMLATLAAPRCSGARDLMLIAPVVSGRAYLRELKALHLAGEATTLRQPNADDTPAPFESGGFVIADETHAALSALDLLQLPAAPAPSMLLIDRDDLPGAQRLANHMQALGMAVEQTRLVGYADMMADPHLAITPPTLAQIVLARIQQLPPLAAQAIPEPSDAPLPPPSPMLQTVAGHHAQAMLDTVTRIGDVPALFGILSTPSDQALRQRPHLGILMLNAGAVRQIGPNRMYLTSARQWAREGRTVLRLDIAGLGDSPAHAGQPDNVVYSDTALQDVATAIAHLRQQAGVQRILVMGLCSGAYHAFKSAVRDMPVDAALIINPLTFFWEPGTPLLAPTAAPAKVAEDLRRHRGSVLHVAAWTKLVRGQISPRRITQIAQQTLTWVGSMAYRAVARTLHLPLKNDLAGELTHVARRGIPMHFVFSEADPGLILLRSFGGTTVSRLIKRQAMDITLIAQADHTFTLAKPRASLIEALNSLIARCD